MTPIEHPDTNHSTRNYLDFRETLPLIWALSAFSVNARFRPSPPPSCQPHSVVIGYLPEDLRRAVEFHPLLLRVHVAYYSKGNWRHIVS